MRRRITEDFEATMLPRYLFPPLRVKFLLRRRRRRRLFSFLLFLLLPPAPSNCSSFSPAVSSISSVASALSSLQTHRNWLLLFPLCALSSLPRIGRPPRIFCRSRPLQQRRNSYARRTQQFSPPPPCRRCLLQSTRFASPETVCSVPRVPSVSLFSFHSPFSSASRGLCPSTTDVCASPLLLSSFIRVVAFLIRCCKNSSFMTRRR